ncbi:MAG TPA: cytochrome c-type biogenesis protein CcmH [Acidimicrobiia bacterium]|nr:cytochrome c-type biogenesis protein CcmH [Acidimicrobiia bacterium]
MTKRLWPWLALGVLVVGVLAVVLWPGADTTPAERAQSIAAGLKCQECQGLSVADSNAETSAAIRADIRRRIAAGESDGEIRQYFVDKYGETILLEPQSSGISLIVWILPVVAIAAGAAGIVFALARNRREPRLHATDADEALVGREREREAHE